jgi:hypothetical protein|tara:strand:- start:525 stop:731 length:207 start_codon:yes stop_codon:yes gene_type:complete
MMEVGDIVKIPHMNERLTGEKKNVGIITKVDRSSLTFKRRYWVKLFGGWSVGPVPFMERQLQVISKSS